MKTDYQNTEILAYARDLALRDYDITVTAEQFADGTIGYLAHTPELTGCKAQGRSVIEAVKSLIDARIDYIYFMLVDMIPVPPPNKESTGNVTYQSVGLTTISAVTGVARANTLTPDDVKKMQSPDNVQWRPIVGSDPFGNPLTGFYRNMPTNATFEVEQVPVVVPHVATYADWDVLWVAILNGDAEEFDIHGVAYRDYVCHIRKEGSVWQLHLTGREFPRLRGRDAHSKSELFALIGYLAEGNIKRVKCLAKKVYHD